MAKIAARLDRRALRSALLDYAVITLGVLMLALANDVFLIPNNVFSGGATGAALLINSYVPLPVGTLVLLVNIPLVVLGILFLGGWRFLARTTYAVVVYSLLLDLLRPLSERPVTTDPLLYTLYGGLLAGLGIGLVFRSKGTTGGDDIVAQLIFRFKGIPVNASIVAIDAVILALVGLRFGPEKALYALISAFAASKAIDFTLQGFRPTRMAYIISDKPDEIAARVQSVTGRGVTFLTGQGAYTGRPYRVILTAVRQAELPVVTEIVRDEDQSAFVIVSEAREVLGYGFKPLPEPPPQPPTALRATVRHVRKRLRGGGGSPTSP
ncbi:MAG TPA: YitT family protein [Chloroflexia bacterium]|nr:YitT family protein [Chloroflexia bacterium]